MNKLMKVLLTVVLCGGLAIFKTIESHAVRKNGNGAAGATQAQPTPTCAPFATPNPNPPTPPAPALSATIPLVVDLGSGGGISGPADAQWFFDTFSWQSFIAVNWPAAVDQNGLPQRGVPNTNTGINPGSPGTRVWETWKADWELFRPIDPQTKSMGVPTDWSSYALNPPADPCPNTDVARGAKVMTQVTKMDSVLNGFNEAFSSPLIDQNKLYVRYEIRFNQTGYTTIANNAWYQKKNLPAQVAFPISGLPVSGPGAPYGIIEIKAAWRELATGEDGSRYYTVSTTLLDPGNPQTCRTATMALVGLHIGHKASLRSNGQQPEGLNEWIWSTFEHVDNVNDKTPGQQAPFSFNNNNPTPTTQCPSPNQNQNCGYSYQPPTQSGNKPFPPIAQRTPVQVTRVTPISNTTAAINAKFRQFLKDQLGTNTVWQYYQLVATQWPTHTNGQNFNPKGAYPAACDCPFPNDHVANTAAETYFQQLGTNSCMSCHFGAANRDFSWTLALKASGPPASPQAATNKAGRNAQPNSRDALRKKITKQLGRQK